MIDPFRPEIIKYFGLPDPIREYKFHIIRRWRFDFAYSNIKLAIELEGGLWQNGRHNRATGYIKDMEKYNAAVELGWGVLRYQPKNVDYEQIKRILESRSNNA